MITNFTKRTHDHLHDLLEQLEGERDERTRRAELYRFFHSTHLALLRLHVLSSFLLAHGEEFDRLGAMGDVLAQRDFLFQSAVDVLKVTSSHVDQQLLPAYDLSTAFHVLSTGDYRLLPRVVERVLDEKQRMEPGAIERVQRRLNSALHLRLLSTRLPPDLTAVEVEGGVVRLVSPACSVSVSLRMMPRGEAELTEESRIKWRLFAVDWRMRGEGEDEAALVGEAHTAHLIAHCNALMHNSASPLLTLHRTLHSFISNLLLGLLHQQAAALQSHYQATSLSAHYVPAQTLSLTYWKEAQLIPHPGAVANNSSSLSPASSSSLTITVEQHRLLVTHSPPLPELEGEDSAAASTSSLFSIDPQSVSLTRLFARILASHSRYRIQQLQALIERTAAEEEGPAPYERMRIDPQDDDDNEGAEEEDMKGQEDDDSAERISDAGDDARDEHLLRRVVLSLWLVPGWTLQCRVDQQSGRFIFSWAHRFSRSSPSSSRAALDPLLSPLSSLQSFASLPSALRALQRQARLSLLDEELATLHSGHRLLRRPPLLWSSALPAPIDPTSAVPPTLLYIRLLSSPLFFLLLLLPGAGTDRDWTAAVAYFFVQCDLLDSPSSSPASSPSSSTPKRAPLQCGILTPIDCTPLPRPSLPDSPALSSPLFASSTNSPSARAPSTLALSVVSATASCEQRVPLALLLHLVRRHPHSDMTVLSPTTSASFLIPFPPQAKPEAQAKVTVTIEWSSPLATASALSSSSPAVSAIFASAAASASASFLAEETDPSALRCTWTAAVEQPHLLRMYRGILQRRQQLRADAHSTAAVGMAILPLPSSLHPSQPSRSPAAILLHFRSISPSSLASLFDHLLHLHLCCQLEMVATSGLSPEKWAAAEAQHAGDCPPPGFFSVVSCSTSAVALRYNLRTLPYADQPDDFCTLTLRYRRPDADPAQQPQAQMLPARRTIPPFTIHTHPYPFPHHAFLEFDFNHRLDIASLLKHIYWGCSAVKAIHAFIERVTAYDQQAGYQQLLLQQQVTMSLDTATSTISLPQAASPSSQIFLLSFAPALYTVSVLPQSSTRLRFLFRKQQRAIRCDIRLLNGYSFVQDLSGAADGRGGREPQQPPPSRLRVGELDTFLMSWYQRCGQHEQWRRVSKASQLALTVPVLFDKATLGARPTSQPLIQLRMQGEVGGEAEQLAGLSKEDAGVLRHFFSDWVCVPPYAGEAIHSFLSLCSSPLHVITSMCQLLALQLSSHAANAHSTQPLTSSPPASPYPLSVRWFHHLNAPFDLHYDATHDVVCLVLQLSDRVRGESVHVPLAFCLATGAIGWWEMEEETRQSQDKAQPPTHRIYRRIRRPGGSAEMDHTSGGREAPRLAERWKSLRALVEALMSLDVAGLVQRLAQLSPPMSMEQWSQHQHLATGNPNTATLTLVDGMKAVNHAPAPASAPQGMDLTAS